MKYQKYNDMICKNYEKNLYNLNNLSQDDKNKIIDYVLNKKLTATC